MQEVWKPIVGYESLYEVSNVGRVRSLDRYVRGVSKAGLEHLRLHRGRILKTSMHTHGYRVVTLSARGEYQTVLVHDLVATAFIENPDGLPEVNHKDLNKANNTEGNLEWCTRKFNQQHAAAAGRFSDRGEDKGTSKLTDERVREIRRMIARGMKNTEIARPFHVSTAPISYIRTGKAWTHVI